MEEKHKHLLSYFWEKTNGEHGTGRAITKESYSKITEETIIGWEKELKEVNGFEKIGVTNFLKLDN